MALQSAYDAKAGVPQVNVAKQGPTPLTDNFSGNFDILYYGPLQLGTAGQRMTVDVDTGSADLWVPVDCTNCPHPGYNAQGSSSYRNTNMPFEVTYVSPTW